MTGIKKGSIALETQHLTGLRKKPCLLVRVDNRGYMIGQFKNDEASELFWKVFDFMIGDVDEAQMRELIEGGDAHDEKLDW